MGLLNNKLKYIYKNSEFWAKFIININVSIYSRQIEQCQWKYILISLKFLGTDIYKFFIQLLKFNFGHFCPPGHGIAHMYIIMMTIMIMVNKHDKMANITWPLD